MSVSSRKTLNYDNDDHNTKLNTDWKTLTFRPTQPGHPSVGMGRCSVQAMVLAIAGEETVSSA